ncbi:MAG: LptF/LptG family permease, partial [Myxococcales bacterium]
MRLLWRYLAAEYLKAFVATLVAVSAIYLVVDFVDRAKTYTGEGWQAAVAELYLHKFVTMGFQLAPAAMLMAAGITLA